MTGHQKRIASVDVLRGWAILAVIGTHTFLDAFRPWKYGYNLEAFGVDFDIYPMIFANGWLGVNLFFVLSGFVLALPFLGKSASEISTGRYYKERLARLLPLFYVSVAVLALFLWGDASKALLKSFELVFFYFTFFPDSWMPSKLPILWSIGLEFWFSMILPFIILLSRKVRIEFIALFFLVFCFLFRAVADELYIAQTDESVLYQGQRFLMVLNPYKDYFFGRIDDFVMGILAAYYYFSRRYKSYSNGLYFIIALLFLSISSLLWNHCVIQPGMSYLKSFATSLFSIGSFILILNVLSRDWSKRYSFFRFLGVRCYSIYIIHYLVLKYTFFKDLFRDVTPFEPSYWLVFFAYFVVMLLISEFTYQTIEKMGKKWFLTTIDQMIVLLINIKHRLFRNQR